MPATWLSVKNSDLMHSGIFVTGFWLGTIKFMFAHWLTYYAAQGIGHDIGFLELFISVHSGCMVSMSISYFFSSMLMRLAAKRRREKENKAIALGKPYTPKKKFTRTNKAIVWVKRNIGIYGVTFVAPMFLSIPLGSVICAKFYGHRKITFPLMVTFMTAYSVIMCLLIELM